MKRFILVLLACLLCFSAVSCTTNAPAIDEMQAAGEGGANYAVSGKWQCKLKLADVMSEAAQTVWSQKMEGNFVIALELTADGKVNISADVENAEEYLRKYFLSSGYSEEAAAVAAEHNAKALVFGEELSGLTYTVDGKTVSISSGAKLSLSDDGKIMTVAADTVNNLHSHDAKTCKWFGDLVKKVKFERA